MVPPFPPNPYVDAPGYIMPHSQLHLVDYRRMMNPHMAPTVAYQARRFRYQHTSNPRVMVSSEVQTEPTLGQGQSPIRSVSNRPDGPTNSESGRETCFTGSASASTSTSTSSASSTEVKTPERVEPVVMATSQQPISSTFVSSATPRTTVIQDHILFQAEEVQIKCSGTIADVKIARCEETTKLVTDTHAAVLHCDAGVPCLPVAGATQNAEEPKEGAEVKSIPVVGEAAPCEEPYLPPCPDILLTGASPSTGPSETSPPTEGTTETTDAPDTAAVQFTLTNQAEQVISEVGSSVVACGDLKLSTQDDLSRDDLAKEDFDLFSSSKNPQFKILHLPFDLQYGDVQHLETSVWSVESLLPYVPTSEWLIQNGLMTPQKGALSPVMEDAPCPTLEPEADSLPEGQQAASGAGIEPDPHDSMTSLESLPPYLPSPSWLTDFGNVYVYHKMQPNVRQQLGLHGDVSPDKTGQDLKVGQHTSQTSSAPPSRRREEHSRHKRRTGGTSDISDHECQAVSSHGEGLLSPPPHASQRCVCVRSLTKRGAGASTSPTPSMKRHKHPQPQRDTAKSPSFATCKCLHGSRSKSSTKGSGSDVPGRLNDEDDTTEGEASENSLRPKRASESRKVQYVCRHSDNCPVAQRPKLREQNCSCDMPKCNHLFSGPREGSGPRGDSGWHRGEMDPGMSTGERHRIAEQKGGAQKCQPGKKKLPFEPPHK